MPTYSLSGPDGAEYEIDAPDEGAAFKAFQSLGPAQNAPASTATDAPAAGVAGDGSAAVGRGILNGVPVVGPALLGGAERLAAGIRSYQNSTPYADELQKVQAFSQGTADANPKATTAGEIGGGIVGTAPLIAAAPAAFGAAGGGLGARALASMASGVGLGSSDSAVRSALKPDTNVSEVASDAIKGGAVGGVLGAAAPVAGSLVGAGARRFYDMLGGLRAPESGFSPAATRDLQGRVTASGGVEPVQARLNELGARSMLLDASDPLQGAAQGLGSRPETRGIIQPPVMQRAAGASDRLSADINTALGPAQSPAAITADFRGQRMDPNRAIGAAVDGAPNPVSARDVLYSIEGRLPQARGAEEAVLRRAQGMLAREDADGFVHVADDPRILHNVKQEMDNVINYGAPDLGVQPGSQTRKDSAAQMVRSHLNEILRDQVPEYAAANDASSALARQIGAVERAPEILRSGEQAIAPADFARQVGGMEPGVRDAYAQATRGLIDRAVGVQPNDVSAMRSLLHIDPASGQGGWNAQKLAALHGDQPIQNVVGAVNRERAFAAADNNIVRNSQTAQRAQAASAYEPRGALGTNVGDAIAAGTGGLQGLALNQAAKLGRGILNGAQHEADIARNQDVARALVLNPGQQLGQLLAAINARAATARQAAALGTAVGRGSQAALVSQSDRTQPYASQAASSFLTPLLR